MYWWRRPHTYTCGGGRRAGGQVGRRGPRCTTMGGGPDQIHSHPSTHAHQHEGEAAAQELDVHKGRHGHQQAPAKEQHPQEVGRAAAEGALLQALGVAHQEEHVEEEVKPWGEGGGLVFAAWRSVIEPIAGAVPAAHARAHQGSQSRRSL